MLFDSESFRLDYLLNCEGKQALAFLMSDIEKSDLRRETFYVVANFEFAIDYCGDWAYNIYVKA